MELGCQRVAACGQGIAATLCAWSAYNCSPKHPSISQLVTAGLQTVGLRIPDHEVARTLIRTAGVPVAAPSANRSGKPSGTTWQTVLEDLDGRIDAVLRGHSCAIGIESTVVDCVNNPPRLLRPGAISLEQLSEIVPSMEASSTTAQTLMKSVRRERATRITSLPHASPWFRTIEKHFRLSRRI